MCVFELSELPRYEFRYDYIKHKYGNKQRLLFRDTDSLMHEIEIKHFMTTLARIKKKCLILKYYTDSNTLVVGKMKDKMGGVAIERFVGLEPKKYLLRVNDSRKYKWQTLCEKCLSTAQK